VQKVLNERLTRRVGDPVKVSGASRTDAGVHAEGQAIHFDLKRAIDPAKFEDQINYGLPLDVKLYDTQLAHEISDDSPALSIFNARGSALGKVYDYRFCTRKYVSPLKARYYAHHTPFMGSIDVTLLNRTLQLFVGSHNFKAFGNKLGPSGNEDVHCLVNTNRTIHSISFHEEHDKEYYGIRFNITSAIYRMIRNIVGASIEVAKGDSDIDTVRVLLEGGGSRVDNHAAPASACGLCLMSVQYADY
jgi:tRNA pseudouridine38-40 synthase